MRTVARGDWPVGDPRMVHAGFHRMSRLSRRAFVVGAGASGAALLAGCGRLPWQAEAPARVPRVGYLALNNTPVAEIEAFRDGLRELGYVDGRTIAIDVRLAESTEH